MVLLEGIGQEISMSDCPGCRAKRAKAAVKVLRELAKKQGKALGQHVH